MFYDEAEKCIVLCANCHHKEHTKLRLGVAKGQPPALGAGHQVSSILTTQTINFADVV